jgi:hypothetical protein
MPVLTGPWSVGTAADFAVIVRELGAAFLHPAWLPAGRLGRPEGLESDFTTVSADVAFDVLGLVAAVLSEVVTGEASGVERVQPGLAGIEVVPVDLGSLISGLSEQALTTLERSAGRWPAMIAEGPCMRRRRPVTGETGKTRSPSWKSVRPGCTGHRSVSGRSPCGGWPGGPFARGGQGTAASAWRRSADCRPRRRGGFLRMRRCFPANEGTGSGPRGLLCGPPPAQSRRFL